MYLVAGAGNESLGFRFPLLGCDVRYQSGVFSVEESELYLSMLMSEQHVCWNTVSYGRDIVQFSSPKGMR